MSPIVCTWELSGSQLSLLPDTLLIFCLFASLISCFLSLSIPHLGAQTQTHTYTFFFFFSPGVRWSRCLSSRELITALMRMIAAHLSSSTSNREHLLLPICVSHLWCVCTCACVRVCCITSMLNSFYMQVMYTDCVKVACDAKVESGHSKLYLISTFSE